MSIVTNVLAILVAGLFLFIMYLETVITSSEKTSQVFNIPVEELAKPNLNVLMRNQGIYNGLVGVGLLYGVFLAQNPHEVVGMCLVYAISVAVYGAITSDKMILLKQGGLPILALLSLWLLG